MEAAAAIDEAEAPAEEGAKAVAAEEEAGAAAEEEALAAALEESARLEEERRAAEAQGPSSSAQAPAPREAEPPADFICPITTEVMIDPVMEADGHSYERSAIERWLATKSTSPMTSAELENTGLFPNHTLRRMIRQWQQTVRSDSLNPDSA